MKILIPILKFCPTGGYRVLSELSNNWKLLGHQVTFLSYYNSPLPYFPTDAKIIWFNFHGKVVDRNNINPKNYFSSYPFVIYAMIKAINNQHADIVLANHSLTALPVSLSSIKCRKFYYIQAYEPAFYESFKSLKGLFFRYISKISYRHSLHKIVNSPLYFDYYEIKSRMLVYPGLNFKKFKHIPKVTPNSSLVIGCIGRIEPYKGTSFVIDAFKLLKARALFPVNLHIAFGDSSLESEYGVKCISLNGDEELSRFYNSLDILIAPGTILLGAVHYPVLEAMACKIPVITTGYYPADNSNAWIVPVKDSKSICDVIIKIYNSKEEARIRSDKAFEDVKEFSWLIQSEKMLNYFDNLVD